MKFDNIYISAINLSDETFYYAFHSAGMDQLVASIKAVGLLNPITLIKKENQESFRLVHGLRRVKAAQKLKIEKIFARIYDESELSAIDFFNLSLYENAVHRQFNAIEQGIIIDKLIRQFQVPISLIEQVYLPLIGLGSNPKVIERYQSLINLELPLKNAIADDFMGVDLALKLVELPEPDRSFFLDFCLKLKTGKNRQKEFYNLFSDLAHINKKSFVEIAQNLKLDELIEDDF
ncbi:ParB N-terminal domain-containing protein, partial [candidate division KSB1 bacterium]|nr:ParB N-terminal domain-containing protein [candidate division KSB1 bacterium]